MWFQACASHLKEIGKPKAAHPGSAAKGLSVGDLISSVTTLEQVLCSIPFIPMGSGDVPALPGSALLFVLPGENVSVSKLR